jgi:phage tail sheath protein FI/rhodanese-related sulfurtransferase
VACAIEPASTSTAAFVGEAETGPPEDVVLVTSPQEHAATFGATGHLAAAARGFFANGGRRLWVARLDAGVATALARLDDRDDVAILACPGLTDPATVAAAAAWCEARRDCVLVADVAPGLPAQAPVRSSFAAAYAPWLVVDGEAVPPSGHVAGVLARTDAWDSPAGTEQGNLLGATDVATPLTGADQDALLAARVNPIRRFAPTGPLVWGARTLAADTDRDFAHLASRRLAVLVEQSILRGTRWAVHEPDGEPLWTALQQRVEAFLLGLLRAGALQGRTPHEAFFVRREDAGPGVVAMLVGIATSRPSEFVLLRPSITLRRRTVHELLDDARRRLARVQPAEVAAAVAGGALVVDIRSELHVGRDGRIPGAVHHPRNVLEWRLDPASGHSDPALAGALERQVILVCDEGHQSSLAAATLQDLGFRGATDLAGGFRAWLAAGLPVEPDP